MSHEEEPVLGEHDPHRSPNLAPEILDIMELTPNGVRENFPKLR
jgi:hypothetical protein